MVAWFRLSLVFSIAGLLASRMGLLVHEFAGHGGMARALGGTVPGWRLFLFGGGWIQYERDPWYSSGELLAVTLAGVGCEILVAALLLILATRLAAVPRAMARIAAFLLCAHTCVYIATGSHYGFGDGLILHNLLAPAWRVALVVSLSLLMTCMAYLLAREALHLAATLEVPGGVKRLFWVGLAIVVASGVHSGLYFAERALIDQDQTYEALMKREVERRAERYEAILAARQKEAGETWTVEQAEVARTEYVRKHEPFPLRPLLLLLGALAAAFASWRHHRYESEKLVPWRMSEIRAPGLLLAMCMLAIMVIDAFG
jgi:hypothetical protein